MSKHAQKILWILCILLIAAQTVIAAFFTAGQTAGLQILKNATQVYETGQIVIAAPLMSLWGLICRLFHMSPVFFALHILPFIMIPACYGAYIFLIRSFCEGKTVPLTLLIVCLLQIFGYQSDAFVPATLLLGWYTGYALVLHLLCPLLLGVLLTKLPVVAAKEVKSGEDTADEEDEDMKHKYLNVRNLGIALLLFFVIALSAIFVLNRKINNLHAATENLQKSISDKGELIEFTGAVGDDLKGYILKGSQGSLTVIFCGDKNDGPALCELLSGYGGAVDSWYLREDEQGAYEYCVKEGITVEHVYTVNGMEEVL